MFIDLTAICTTPSASSMFIDLADTACFAYFPRFADFLATPRPPQTGEQDQNASTLCHQRLYRRDPESRNLVRSTSSTARCSPEGIGVPFGPAGGPLYRLPKSTSPYIFLYIFPKDFAYGPHWLPAKPPCSGVLQTSKAMQSRKLNNHMRRVQQHAMTIRETADTAYFAYFTRFADVLATPRPPQSGEQDPSPSTLCLKYAKLPRFKPC